MIPEWIHLIHHVSQINQVLIFYFHFLNFLNHFYKDNGTPWQYSGPTMSLRSSLIIFSNSLPSNQTYQFMLVITNRQNASLQATGYVLVQVQDSNSQIITLA
jgi:hypothetical protein